MKYLSIVNNGEIDIKALILLGASSKRESEGKIGRYGSGNKFAIATIMRLGGLTVFSGEKEIVIDTVPQTFREKTFNVIRIAGEPTSITTEFGPDWEFWQAIREFYANAIDEGGELLRVSDEPMPPQAGKTVINVWCREDKYIEGFAANFNKYFSMKRKPIFENSYGKIFYPEGSSASIFRKGIRCIVESPAWKTVYDYDFNDVDISESRLALYPFRLTQSIWSIILMSNVEIFRTFIMTLMKNEYFEREYSSYYPYPNTTNIASDIILYLGENCFAPYTEWSQMDDSEREMYHWLPEVIYKALERYMDPKKTPFYKKKRSKAGRWEPCEPTPLQKTILKRAESFLKEVGFDVPYPIECVRFFNTKTMGSVDEDRQVILLSASWLEKGAHEAVNTIIEEYIHLRYSVNDYTPEFQTCAINTLIGYMMQKNAITL